MNKWVLVGSFVIAFLIGTLAVFIFTKEDSPDEIMQDVVEEQVLTIGVGEDVWNPDGEPYIDWYAPPNSFGISHLKVINNTYFWGLFYNHTSWTLWESNNKVSWTEIDADGTLNITKIRSGDNNSDKVIINFTSPATAYYQVRFNITSDVASYSNDTGYHYNLTYVVNETSNYSVYFNWGDLVNSSWGEYLEYNHGVWNNTFMFNATSINKVTKNTFVSLDPGFGRYGGTGNGGSSIANAILGTPYVCPSAGTLDNISACLDIRNEAKNVTLACYVNSSKVLVAQSEERLIPVGTGVWYTFNVSGSPSLSASTNYLLVAWGYDGVNQENIRTQSGYSDRLYRDPETYNGTYKSPIDNPGALYDYEALIYANYTESAAGASWQSLPYMQFNISFSSSSEFNDLNSLQYNLSVSNTSVFNSLFGLQYNISFSNSASFSQIPTMSYNISISNSTEYQQIPTMSYNLSFSNSTFVAWQDVNTMQFNLSVSNTTQYQPIPSMSYNISFSNTSEVWDDIPSMLFNISFSNSSEELVFISPGVYFGVGNVNYSTNQTLGFTQIVQRDNSIMFNTTNFTLDCANPTWVNLSMIYTNGSTSYSVDELVCDFWADNTGGTSWFNISGFSSNGAFYIHHNNTFLENVNSNASGGISFSHSVNNNRSYKIYNGTVAVGRTWQTINTMQYNISFSNTATWNNLNTLQYNISFSNSPSWTTLPFMQFNLSFSNTTLWQSLNTIQYNISFSNTSVVEWTNLPYMQFNISFSNTAVWNELNTMQYNLSFSNTGSWNNLNTLQYNISFSNSPSWTTLPFMQFNLSFSNSTIWQTLNTMQYNISFSNSSVPLAWSGVPSMQMNISFSNSSPPLLVVDNEYPANNSNITSRQPLLYFNVTSPQGYTMNYTLYIDNTTQIAVGKNVVNGTQQLTNHTYYTAINFSQYWWRVMLNDGQGQWVNYTFDFRIYPDVDLISTPGFESIFVLIAMFCVVLFIWNKRRKENE